MSASTNWTCDDCHTVVPGHVMTCPRCRDADDPGKAHVLVVSTEHVPGHDVVQVFGLVTGCVVQSRHLFSDIGTTLGSLVGGELTGSTRMVMDARTMAQDRLESAARERGANAVLGTRFDNENLGTGGGQSSAFIAYGTAARITRTPPPTTPGQQ